MINFLDVAAPDPIESTNNVGLYTIIFLSVLLVIAVTVTLVILSKKKNK